MAVNDPNPFFEFDLGELGKAFRFSSARELSSWCDREIQYWAWVQNINSGRAFAGLYDQVVEGARRVKTVADQFGATTGTELSDAMSEQLRNFFQQYYCQGSSVHSSHPKADFIAELKNSDAMAAVTMLAVTSGFEAKPNRPLDTSINVVVIWPLSGVALVSGIFYLTSWLSGGLRTVVGTGTQTGATINQPNHWDIVLLVIALTMSIWFLRILVRIFLSHMHRQADAHERITLIKTYLALLQEGGEIVPDDRKIIIQTIFRPSTVGIVKEDAAPASPWEFLSRGK